MKQHHSKIACAGLFFHSYRASCYYRYYCDSSGNAVAGIEQSQIHRVGCALPKQNETDHVCPSALCGYVWWLESGTV